MCVCHYMKKSIFQILNICLGLLGFATILFCSYCFGKLNQFNPFLYTILCVGVVLSALSIKVCTNDFSSKCLMQIYLVVLCVVIQWFVCVCEKFLDNVFLKGKVLLQVFFLYNNIYFHCPKVSVESCEITLPRNKNNEV